MITSSQLVWSFDAGAEACLTNWRENEHGDRHATARITVEDHLRKIRGGERLDWWRGLSDSARAELSLEMMRRAAALLDHPPPWKWWAGTLERAGGWVCRNEYTGWLQPVSVRGWDLSKPSGIRTAIKRFVRPAEQQELF